MYKKVDIASVSVSGDAYTISCKDEVLEHLDGGQKLKVEVGARMVLIPGNVFVEVSEIVGKDNGIVIFNAVPFEPTDGEREAYVCGYYDD